MTSMCNVQLELVGPRFKEKVQMHVIYAGTSPGSCQCNNSVLQKKNSLYKSYYEDVSKNMETYVFNFIFSSILDLLTLGEGLHWSKRGKL